MHRSLICAADIVVEAPASASSATSKVYTRHSTPEVSVSCEVTPPPRRHLARSTTTPIIEGSPQPSSRTSARDLSHIFSSTTDTAESGPSRPPLKAQTGVARRMLARSRTESSVISINSTSESGSGGVEGPSTHATPRKLRTFRSDHQLGSPSERPSTPSPSRSRVLDDVSSPPVRPSIVNTNTNVRTYAGKSRSFLVALPQSQAGSLGLESHSAALIEDSGTIHGESQEDDFDMRESYTELRERWGVDASEDDPRPVSPVRASPSPKGKGKKRKGLREEAPVKVLPYGMTNDLKSITELRSKGESRRFLDEVGYLFEGLDANGALGVRRGRCVERRCSFQEFANCLYSALEIVTKLCDIDFTRRAKTTDFLGRAWEVLREAGAGDGDKVCFPISGS